MQSKKKDTTQTPKISERGLPVDYNAEAAILSAMLIDSNVVSKGIEMIKEEYLAKPAHKTILRTIRELFNESIETDSLTLIDRLQRNNQLEKVGGLPYISELVDFVVSSANFEYHLNIVIERALLRHLIVACNGIIESCYTSTKPVKDIVDEAEQTIFNIAELPSHQGFVNMAEISRQVASNIDLIASTRKPVVGVASGFS